MKLNNTMLFIFMLVCIYNGIAQQKDTLYFNAKWDETEKVNASYYRPLPLKTKGDFEFIEDYYINGKPQMKGWSHKEDGVKHDGEVIWYFENGNKAAVRNYNNGEFNGVHTAYYENGSVKSVGTFVDNKWEGEAKGYNEDGKLIYDVVYKNNSAYQGTTKCFSTYEKGELVSKKVHYEGSSQVAYEEIYLEESEVINKTHFNRQGDITGKTLLKRYESVKNGQEIEYYKSENCGYTKGIKKTQTIKNERMEGEEVFYDEQGNISHKGTNKDGKPYEGTFREEHNGLYYISTYKSGNKYGEEYVFNTKNKEITRGTYLDSKRYEGTFAVRDDNNRSSVKLLTLKQGKEEGKQSVYLIKRDFIKEYYYVKNGLKDGESVSYNYDGTERSKMIYKNGTPYEGAILDDDENFSSYEKGTLHGEQITTNYKGEEYIEFYENGVRTEVEDHSFYINGKTGLKGIYKKRMPYTGYFKKDFGELTIVDYYEKGEKKFQYTPNSFFDMDDEQLDLSVQSTYKNGKIYDGVVYTWKDKALIIDVLEKGEVVGFTFWVFAIHYANNITVKKSGKGYVITEGVHPNLKVKLDKNAVSLISSNNVISRKEHKPNSFVNKRIIYYEKDGKLETQEFNQSEITNEYKEVITDYYIGSFLIKIYTFLLPEEHLSKAVLNELKKLIANEEESPAEFTLEHFVSILAYDEKGKINGGMLIEENKNRYTTKIYLDGKLIETKEATTIEELKAIFKEERK